MKKRALSLLLTTVMVVTTLAGCGKNSTENTATTTATTKQIEDNTAATSSASDKVEFEFFGTIYDPYVEESFVLDAWQENANAKVNFTWNQTDSAATQLAARVANKDLPEVIFTSAPNDLISQKLLMPITDLIDEYMPNFKSRLTDDDMVYLINSDDNEIYGIGLVMDIKGAYSTIIRDDWLKALNLEYPKTWDEWVNYWTLVKENDLNENGDYTDEVPLSVAYNMMYMLMSPFGINSNGYFSVVNGEYIYDPENEKYEAFLDGMRDLYAKGILNPEFLTCDDAKMKDIGNGDKLGSTVYWAEGAKNWSIASRELGDADALYQCVTPIVGPNGDAALLSRNKISQNTFFSIECGDRLPEILKAFDYIYSDEGITLTNFGVEGVSFEYEDGKPVSKAPYNESFAVARSYDIIPSIIPFCFVKDSYMQYLLGGSSVDSLEAPGKSFVDGLTINDDYYYASAPIFKTTAYIDHADLVAEQIALRDKYIMGTITKDEYNSGYENLKKNGLQDVIDQGKAAYAALNQ